MRGRNDGLTVEGCLCENDRHVRAKAAADKGTS
jgi:hypothetical protein